MIKNSVILLGSLLACSSSAFAQGKEPVSLGFEHKFDADLDSGGSVSIDRLDVNFALSLVSNDKTFAALTFSHSVDDFDFGPAFNPWSKIRTTSIALPMTRKLKKSWTWSSMTRLGSSAEQGANRGGSYNWSHVSTFDHHMTDDLTLGAGLSIVSKLEDDASVIPVISIDWQINDKWSFHTLPSEGVSSGVHAAFKYEQSDDWSYTAGFVYSSKRFRLSQTSAVAADGVGEESYAALYGVAKYQPSKNLSISFIAGYSFGNEFSVYDTVGNDVAESDADATPFAGLRVNYEF